MKLESGKSQGLCHNAVAVDAHDVLRNEQIEAQVRNSSPLLWLDGLFFWLIFRNQLQTMKR